MVNKRKPLPKKLRLGTNARFFAFITSFAVMGGLVYVFVTHASPYYSGASSECAGITQSDTVVRPGDRITAQVKIRNTSSNGAYFSDVYGAHLLEFNNADFTNYWTPNRFTPALNVPPGQTASFNIATYAPSTQGTYPFGWAIGIGASGAVAYGCTGSNVRVINPPSVTLTANGQSQSITVTKGAALTLAWSPTNADSCSASGSWSGAKSRTPSSENRTADTSVAGVRTYTLTCSNALPASAAATVKVTVNDPPATPPNNTGGSGGGSTTPKTPKTTTPTIPAPTPDTTPPVAPTTFTGAFDESVINLSWNDATDDRGIKNYSVERSVDGTTWELLTGEGVATTSFSDTSVAFNTIYQYRLRAFDQAGNASGYATTTVQAGSFEPNLKHAEEFSVSSEDGVVTVTIPSNALEEDALCDLRNSDFLPPAEKDHESVSGPYELLCKLADGNKVKKFAQAPMVKLTLSKQATKKYTAIKVYGQGSEDWQSLASGEQPETFVLGDATGIAILGQVKKTPIWVTILKIVFILALLVGGGIAGLRAFYKFRYRDSLQNKARDFYNKEHGY